MQWVVIEVWEHPLLLVDIWLIPLNYVHLAFINSGCSGVCGAHVYAALRVSYVFYIQDVSWFFEAILIIVGFAYLYSQLRLYQFKKVGDNYLHVLSSQADFLWVPNLFRMYNTG